MSDGHGDDPTRDLLPERVLLDEVPSIDDDTAEILVFADSLATQPHRAAELT